MLKSENLSGLASYPTARTNLGLGLTDSPTFKNLVIATGSIATSAPVTISQTWADVAQTFKALVVNAAGTSNANSASGSLLLDLQVGGVSKVYADKDGAIYGTGTVSGGTFKTWMNASGYYQVDRPATGLIFAGYPGQFFVPASSFIGWNATEGAGGAIDTKLFRDGAPNTLALRNGAAVPQAFRVYNTFLGTTANEWFEIDWRTTAGSLRLATTSGGTGVARPIEIIASGQISLTTGSGFPIDFRPAGVTRWTIHTPGNLWATTDNAYDIGASGANRPRNIYVGTSLFTGVGGINFDINARLRSPATDVITLYNNGLSDFGRLQFGGTADTFPALKRSTTRIQAVLATTDTTFTNIQGKLTTDTAYTGTTVVPTGFLTLYDSTGTAYKVPCVAA
jgi:hypothetical protein